MSSTAISAQGTLVKIATGSGSAVTITDIAVGYPTILTASAHGLSNGDVVAAASFAGTDAADINSHSWVISNVTTNTFAIQLNSVGKTITDNTNSATMTPTSYTNIANVTSFNGFDGSASVIDKTNFDSTAKEFMLGLVDNGQVSFNVDLAWSDSGQAAAEASRVAGTRKSWKVVLPSGTTPTATFYAYTMKFSKGGAVDQKVAGMIDLKIDGAVSWS